MMEYPHFFLTGIDELIFIKGMNGNIPVVGIRLILVN